MGIESCSGLLLLLLTFRWVRNSSSLLRGGRGNSLFVRSDELCFWSAPKPVVVWKLLKGKSPSSVADLTDFSVE